MGLPKCLSKSVPLYLLTPMSDNHKTGRMAVSTSPKWTCPPSCPFHGCGCYAELGPLNMWWQACSNNKKDPEKEWQNFLDRVMKLPEGRVFRHNQAGDLVPVHIQRRFEIDKEKAIELLTVCQKAKVRGYTYTHYPILFNEEYGYDVISNNRSVIITMNRCGFAVNISANSLGHLDAIIDSGLRAPLTVTLPSGFEGRKTVTPKGRMVLVCPAIWKKIRCSQCLACANPNRKAIIGFTSHGTKHKACDKVIAEWDRKYMH